MGNAESSSSSLPSSAKSAARNDSSLNPNFSVNRDDYTSVEEVQGALRDAGLESSDLIVGIDFTKSNEWTGKHSYGGRSLHAIGAEPNSYEQALSILGRTLSSFDDDNLIPCFGFGDSTTHDKDVFSFYADHRPCEGFEDALARYRTIVPHIRLAGPTSFAPIINAAIDIVEARGGQYHVLVIIADGQVTRSVDVADGLLSAQEQATVDAIVNASGYALSIVLVGVGDGPWDMMQEFDDNLPHRTFDNFQFINFTEVIRKNLPPLQREAQFALGALMEIPHQYKATQKLHLLGTQRGSSPGMNPLLPPPMVLRMEGRPSPPQDAATQNVYEQHHGGYNNYSPANPPEDSSASRRPDHEGENIDCPICLTDRKNMAFNCGHQTCQQCASSLSNCPICREAITTKIRLY